MKSAENRFKTQSLKPTNLLFSGVLFEHKKKRQFLYIPSLFELFLANTVEGFVFNPQLSFTQNAYDGRFYTLKPSLRYGFSNQRIQAKLETKYYYLRRFKAVFQISGGRSIEQINGSSTLTDFNNTNYTFLQGLNYLKIYERTFLEIGHSHSPVKDFLISGTLSWNQRNPLQNLPRYEEDSSEYTSNDPINQELFNTAFTKHKVLLWEAKLTWQWEHRYIRRRGELVSDSPYPAVSLVYSGALKNVLGSDMAYQKIAFQISQQFKSSKLGTGNLYFETGDFLTKDALTFVDFRHFNGSKTAFRRFQMGDFQLLDYYENSTTDFYLQAHYEHQLNPINLKNKKIYPLLSLNYLYTATNGAYLELGAGIYHLKSQLSLEIYNSWQKGNYEDLGIRIGFRFEE
ncbi:MAG: hypothetical protein Sapg2KO_07200 [Saprospiraceae bacterium]